ncbi:hypothetical protein DBV08_00045 [Rhodococcus sp. KBW08]|uniref:hypothetical protein n=1 Tax=Rhodococcus sp. KBW08 TaxID=2144188 RepID=UPI000F595FA9|nr:hypothetical protein [Rhodococcus sp. KBW08]RQO52731.1 hypothetical protein DBV08_00045 [Rhodococcus sp. KBW08]
MHKKVWWGVIIFVAFVVAWIPAHYVFAYITGDRWNETQWSAAGAWVGAGAAAFLACVSVWQTRKANEQARQATKQARDDAVVAAITSEAQRVSDLKDAKDLSDAQLNQAKAAASQAQKESEARRTQDAAHHQEQMKRLETQTGDSREQYIRDREYAAVEAVHKAVGVYVAEVHNHIRAIEAAESLTVILEKSEDLIDSEKMHHEILATYLLENRQMNLVRNSNDCIMTAKSALYQIENRGLRDAATGIVEKMVVASRSYTDRSKDNDWDAAGRLADEVNESGSELQKMADLRFEATGVELPVRERPVGSIR